MKKDKLKKTVIDWNHVLLTCLIGLIAGYILLGALSTSPDYTDVQELKSDMEMAYVNEGDLAVLEVMEINPNEITGTEVWVDNDVLILNYPKADRLKVGDTVKVKISDARKLLGIWFVTNE